MSVIGTVESLWRYPVKSMGGEELHEGFIGFPGFYGDRLFAFTSSAAKAGFPYFTAREQGAMLQYLPRFRNAAAASAPPDLAAASEIGPGITPLYSAPEDLIVDVQTPSGETLAVDDPALIMRLGEGLDRKHTLTLTRSERALTDCRPISLISLQTVARLGEETGSRLDKRRFRANIYADWGAAGAFGEDTLVDRSLRIGSKAVIRVLERDPRCKMITLDPDTGEAAPAIMRTVAEMHAGAAGVYGAVLVEGMVRSGDAIELLEG